MESFSVPAVSLRNWLNKHGPNECPCFNDLRDQPMCPVEGYMRDRFPNRKAATCGYSTRLYNPDMEYIHPKWLVKYINLVDDLDTRWQDTTTKVFLKLLDQCDERV